ncbi:MAG: heavy metal translocating P-type ATPase, partial [Victivallales bacterium]|nr:heavy metal translocating P-type ATPase [Victivallales bacterium]
LLTIEADDTPNLDETIVQAVTSAGFKCTPIGGSTPLIEKQYDVLGMHCAGCAGRVEKKASAVPGVKEAKVNLVAHLLTIKAEDSESLDGAIVQAVTSAGFKCSPIKVENQEEATPEKPLTEEQEVKQRLIPSLVWWLLIVVLMLLKMHVHPTGSATVFNVTIGILQMLMTLVVFAINRRVFTNGFRHLFQEPDMDSLIALASTASFLLSGFTIVLLALGKATSGHFYFESAAMILVIVNFGKFLEAKAKKKAGDALEKLRDLAPKTVLKIIGDKEVETPAGTIRPGDIIAVRPGSRIPLDGVVTEGFSSIDEASLTGESMPRDVTPGAKVFAGTMNLTGAFRFKAEQVGQETLLAGIIKLVANSSVARSKAVRLADAIAARFVPIVSIIAIITLIVHLLLGHQVAEALSYAITVLVISCPCALGLATPVAVTVSMGRSAKEGILFKGGEALEKLCKIDTIFLDKTGTLTTGKPNVTDITPCNGSSEAELLALAASLEASSEHPIAKCIRQAAADKSLSVPAATNFKSIPGKGITATLDGTTYYAGTADLIREYAPELDMKEVAPKAEELQKQGKTLLFIAALKRASQDKNGTAQDREDGAQDRLYGLIAVRDSAAPTTKPAIEALHGLDLSVAMLSGDSQNTANAIAQELGITDVKAGLLPADKATAVSEARQKGRQVAMVGDGINDAPALSSADLGIAVGTGTDIAMECADIVIMRNDIGCVVSAIRIAKATVRIIRQNLFWAFFYNVLAIPVAAG